MRLKVLEHNTNMLRFQSIVIQHTKNQKNLELNEKRQSIDANPEMIELLKFSDKFLMQLS